MIQTNSLQLLADLPIEYLVVKFRTCVPVETGGGTLRLSTIMGMLDRCCSGVEVSFEIFFLNNREKMASRVSQKDRAALLSLEHPIFD